MFENFCAMDNPKVPNNEIVIPSYPDGIDVFVFRIPFSSHSKAARLRVNNEIGIKNKLPYGCYISTKTASELGLDTGGDAITVVKADLFPTTATEIKEVADKLEIPKDVEIAARYEAVLYGDAYVCKADIKDVDFAKTLAKMTNEEKEAIDKKKTEIAAGLEKRI